MVGRYPKCSTKPVHWTVDLIRKWRVEQRMSLDKFADAVALMSLNAWVNYETGRNKLATLYVIEGILDRIGYTLKVEKKK